MKSSRKEAKVVLIGDTQVGKTSILKRVTRKKFTNNYVPTVGAAYATHHLQADNATLSLQAWDTAGQKKYHCLVPMFLHNATIAIVVYSVTDECSFESVDFWFQRLKDHADPKAIKFLVGNKADLDKKRKVTVEEGRKKGKFK
jgi:Ras-related protein Rab-5C